VNDDLHNGFFVSDQTGWLISHHTGIVLHTRDGGITWRVQAQLDSVFLESIRFADENNGWICGDRGTIYRTSDGGVTWEAAGFKERSLALYGIQFFDRYRGFLVGVDTEHWEPAWLETADGGRSWHRRGNEFPGKGYTDAIHFLDLELGFVGGFRYILRTSDGGVTWRPYDIGIDEVIRDLFFANSSVGWAVGHSGLVLRTEDGGRSWAAVQPFTEGRLRSVVFTDPHQGFIVGDRDAQGHVLFSTLDGGRTWRPIATSYPDLHRLIRSPSTLWIVGKRGTILSYKVK
jgi:photosystem II stability/assembly factor-like uncharacterized protein